MDLSMKSADLSTESFPYFGNKKSLLKYYHAPLYTTIIEPFAGSARYAVKYGLERGVWINDKYHVIYEIWKWIQSATKGDIDKLPRLENKGETLADYKLSDPEKWLLGFATGVGRAMPSNKITAFAEKRKGTTQLFNFLRRVCGKIGHWRITNLSYEEMENIEGTWFIDPPYQYFGKHYKCNGKDMSFKHLGKWCKKRRGQVMVCEAAMSTWFENGPDNPASKPDYLPFMPLKADLRRLQRKDDYVEVVYYQSERKKGLGIF